MPDEKCTPSMLAANLMGDGPRITDAILIYLTGDDEKQHWFRVGSNAWAIGAMDLVGAELINAFIDTPDEAETPDGN